MRRLVRFLTLLYIALSKSVIQAWQDSAEKPDTFWPTPQKVASQPARALITVTGEPPQKRGRKKHRHIGVFGEHG